jgi:hypothetical protein
VISIIPFASLTSYLSNARTLLPRRASTAVTNKLGG